MPLQPIRAAPPVPPPVVVAPAVPAEASEENETLVELQRRQLLFKQAALSAKKSGDTETAVKYLKVSKVIIQITPNVQELPLKLFRSLLQTT